MTTGPHTFRAYEDTLAVTLDYPRHNSHKFVEVHLCDVRAADGLRIHYDFERDGWSIEQASRFEWSGDEPMDHDWQEVAFVEAWGRERKQEGQL